MRRVDEKDVIKNYNERRLRLIKKEKKEKDDENKMKDWWNCEITKNRELEVKGKILIEKRKN